MKRLEKMKSFILDFYGSESAFDDIMKDNDIEDVHFILSKISAEFDLDFEAILSVNTFDGITGEEKSIRVCFYVRNTDIGDFGVIIDYDAYFKTDTIDNFILCISEYEKEARKKREYLEAQCNSK